MGDNAMLTRMVVHAGVELAPQTKRKYLELYTYVFCGICPECQERLLMPVKLHWNGYLLLDKAGEVGCRENKTCKNYNKHFARHDKLLSENELLFILNMRDVEDFAEELQRHLEKFSQKHVAVLERKIEKLTKATEKLGLSIDELGLADYGDFTGKQLADAFIAALEHHLLPRKKNRKRV